MTGVNQTPQKENSSARNLTCKLSRCRVTFRGSQRVDAIDPVHRSDKPRAFATMRAPRRRALPATRGAFDDAGTAASSPRVAARCSYLTSTSTLSPHASSPASETAPQIGYRRSHHFPRFTSVAEAPVSVGNSLWRTTAQVITKHRIRPKNITTTILQVTHRLIMIQRWLS